MKVRSEFVTNSSSTSFGASFGDALLAIFLGLGLGNLDCGGGEGGGGRSSEEDGGGGGGGDADLEGAMAAAEQAAKEAAEKMQADAAAKDALVDAILDSEEDKLNATGIKIDTEIEAYTNQWQDAVKGADPADLDKLNKQYQDYIDYLKGQKALVEAQKYDLAVTKAEEEAAKAAKGDWIKQQQQDLVQVKEQKSFLEAIAKGYGAHKDYNIDEVNSQLKALKDREAALQGTLKENGAEINYTPQDRSPIGPDPEIVRMKQEHEKQMAQLKAEMEKAAAERNAAKRAELAAKQQWLEKQAANEMAKAGMWNTITKIAEGTQVIADVGVDVLSNLTGPAGKSIKEAYTGFKGVAGGLGEGMASWDGKKGFWNNVGTLGQKTASGAVGGLSDIIKDKIGGHYTEKFGSEAVGKAAQNIYNVGAEAGKEVLVSVLEGPKKGESYIQNIVTAGFKGAQKGALDSSLNVIADGLMPGAKSLPEGLDWSDINVNTFVNSIRKSNPLTSNYGRDAIKNGILSAGTDQAKNFIKGDPVIFDNWKQDFTGKVIEAGATQAGKTYTPMLLRGGKMAGNAAKATAATMAEIGKYSASGSPYVY